MPPGRPNSRNNENYSQIADVYRKRLFEKLLVMENTFDRRDAGQEKFAAEEYIARFPGFAEEISGQRSWTAI